MMFDSLKTYFLEKKSLKKRMNHFFSRELKFFECSKPQKTYDLETKHNCCGIRWQRQSQHVHFTILFVKYC